MAPADHSELYAVYLRESISSELDVESPIETDYIDFYDSGIWVARDEGRAFYPYEHVLTIHEGEGTEDEPED
jgi:hypothetical protein